MVPPLAGVLAERVYRMFQQCGIDVAECCGRIDAVTLGSGNTAWRMALSGMAPATTRAGPEDWGSRDVRFVHGTDVPGLQGILRDRRLRAINFSGVYGLCSTNCHDMPDVLRVLSLAEQHPKNQCGIIVEAAGHVTWQAFWTGGTERDAAIVRPGCASHNKREGHWCVCDTDLAITAVWVCETALENMLPWEG